MARVLHELEKQHQTALEERSQYSTSITELDERGVEVTAEEDFAAERRARKEVGEMRRDSDRPHARSASAMQACVPTAEATHTATAARQGATSFRNGPC